MLASLKAGLKEGWVHLNRRANFNSVVFNPLNDEDELPVLFPGCKIAVQISIEIVVYTILSNLRLKLKSLRHSEQINYQEGLVFENIDKKRKRKNEI